MRFHFKYPYQANDIFEIKDNFSRYIHIKSNLEFSDCNVKNPDVTIIIPTYKNRQTIFQAIESAIFQINPPKYEIVILNNNPEEADDFIDKIKSFHSGLIRYYKNTENIGMFGNWNRGIELARAEEIVYLHSDDTLCNNTLNLLWNFHNKVEKDAAILGFNNVMDVEGIIYSHYNAPKKIFGLFRRKKMYRLNRLCLLHAEGDCGCGELFNKNVLMKLGGWNPNVYPASDGIMCSLYMMHSKIYRINAAVRNARVGLNTSLQIGQSYPACGYYHRIAIIDKYFTGNKFLKYLVYLDSISMSIDWCGVRSLKSLNFFQQILCKIDKLVYRLNIIYHQIY